MAFDLRPYQLQAVESIKSEWGTPDHGRTLLVQATGTGKTVVMAAIAEHIVGNGGRVLLLAHRDELLKQAQQKFAAASGLDCAIEKAASHAFGSMFPVTLASVQTLGRPKRLAEYPPNYFTHILIDEAHHALSNSYLAILDYFWSAKVLGVTATPDRADKKDLGKVFHSIAYDYGIDKAVREGYLAPIKAMLIPLEIDITDVKIQAGDYKASDLDESLDPYIPEIARKMVKAGCKDRHTVVFLPLIATARKMADALNDAGIITEEIDGQSVDRLEKIQRFERGETQCLTCSMLLTEGWDCPICDCVVVLRPTKSRALYCQMIGRGTRLHPDKDYLLLLDFLWNSDRHNLCRPASIVAKSQAIADMMTKDIEDAGGAEIDILEEERKAETDAVRQREASLARELAAQKRKRSRNVDPLVFALSIEDEVLADYEPIMPADALPPTEKQLRAIGNFGLSTDGIDCFGKASLILDRLITRSRLGMATPRQIKQLERRGFQHPGTWTFDQASYVMNLLSSNHWCVPSWIDPATYNPYRQQQR